MAIRIPIVNLWRPDSLYQKYGIFLVNRISVFNLLALKQLHDGPSASEVSLEDLNKIGGYLGTLL